jgi:glycosyltransferase involved in cell wall biosynthesis
MISIITPVYNGEEFIRKNIDSIKKLDIPYEHIVVDGGSTDRTLKIVSEEETIILVKQTENTGMYGAIDMGFRVAEGDYICWVNCDDFIYPEEYKKIYEFAVEKKSDFVSSKGIINNQVSKVKTEVRSTRFLKYFLSKGFFPFLQPSVLYSKRIYFEIGGLDFENFKICGDLDLFYRMAKLKNANFGYLPIITSEFLIHGDSLGDTNSKLSIVERKRSIVPNENILLRICLKVLRLLNF